jgi:hypothetical protein
MAALAADCELADEVAVLIAELPRRVRGRVILRLGIRLMATPLGRGALIAALTDVIVERMQRDAVEGTLVRAQALESGRRSARRRARSSRWSRLGPGWRGRACADWVASPRRVGTGRAIAAGKR